MQKTLVIAEKPSVARDIAAALPGSFRKEEGYLESDEFVITYAVGHLVELINPEEYDDRFKRWRMADLPIVPEEFKLRARDKKAEKQLKVAYGKPVQLDDLEGQTPREAAQVATERLMAAIYELRDAL